MSIIDSDTPNDVVWGAAAIATVINKTKRQAFHLLESGLLPARKIGKQWCASRTKLLRAVVGDEPTA